MTTAIMTLRDEKEGGRKERVRRVERRDEE
jgi:hypothetical protein